MLLFTICWFFAYLLSGTTSSGFHPSSNNKNINRPAFGLSSAAAAAKNDDESSSSSCPSEVRDILTNLSDQIDGHILYPTDDDEKSFNDASHVWAMGMDPPLAVLEVQSEQDVMRAVPILAKLKKEFGVPFRIKSGGHHYDGLSTVKDGIVLSLKRLNSTLLSLPPSQQEEGEGSGEATVTFGPAVRVIDFLEQIVQPHSYGAVIGACPTVAEGGFILGGGFSYWSRLHGLGCDNVLSMRVVLANGDVVTASESSNADLFWAMRGAGSAGLGVVTSMTYKVFPSQDKQLYGMGMLPLKVASKFMYNVGAKKLSGHAMIMLFLFPKQYFGDDFVATHSWYDESDDRLVMGKHYLNRTFHEVLSTDIAEKFTFETKSWTEHTRSADMPRKLWRVWNGFLMSENNTEETWSDLLHELQMIRNEAEYVTVEIGLWGGKMSDFNPDDTAFPWRDGLFNICVNLGVPSDVEDAPKVFDEKCALIERAWPKVSRHLKGVYYNYPMKTLTKEEEYGRKYWGDNLDRLQQVKKKYDPEDVFRHPQSIPLPREDDEA